MKLLEKIYIFGISILPFVFWPWADVPFEIPRVWFFNRWVELLVVIVVINVIRPKLYNGKLLFPAIGFVSWAFISSLVGVDFAKSVIGNYYRGDGLFTLLHLLLFAIISSIFLDKLIIHKLPRFIAASALMLSLLTVILNILNLFGFHPVKDFYGVVGATFGQPNFLAGYLLVSLPFTFNLASQRKSLIINIGILFQILSIVLTKSWAGILGLMLYGTYLLYVKYSSTFVKIFIIIAGILSISFGGLMYFDNLNKLKSNSQDGLIAESRQRIYAKGIMAFTQKPVVGWGWSNFDYAFESVVWPIKIDNDVYVDKAHSHLLEIVVTIGLVGVVLYFSLLASVFRNILHMRQEFRNLFLTSLLLFIMHSQTNIISISEEILFWLIASLSSRSDLK